MHSKEHYILASERAYKISLKKDNIMNNMVAASTGISSSFLI